MGDTGPQGPKGDTGPQGAPATRVEVDIPLVATVTESRFVDVDGSSTTSLGDEFIGHGDLLRDGTTVGTWSEFCAITRAAPGGVADLQCTVTLRLPEGDLIAEGELTITNTGLEPATLAITGGTANYRTAQGYVQVSPADSKLTVHLIL
ncbi:hypothetical protein ABT173_10925 [Streptomyces sp. NPDC001795]|uniref:allene oxide cyclase barrel-like domain-containing protein n=1 Tax=unclassified Streptomyces TaxID=2593676 RepID=UPI0033278BDF